MLGFAISAPGSVPGLTLRAWALVTVNTGASPQTIVKSGGTYGVASVTRASAGNYTLTTALAMPDTSTIVQVLGMHNYPIAVNLSGAQTTTTVQVVTEMNATALDPNTQFWIGIYGP